MGILNTVPIYGLGAVDAACRQALKLPVVNKEIVLNILHRSQDKEPAAVIDLPERLMLKNEPLADCQRYERLMKWGPHVAK